jgi:putative GTP pyrophosphokinase
MNEHIENNQLVTTSEAHSISSSELAKRMLEVAVDYKELRMMYACAIKEVQTKFEVLDTEYSIRYQRNPISSIQSRLKSSTSVIEKMMRKSVPFSLENIEAHIQDMAGIRVICSYVDDIYMLAEALISQDDITLIDKKDYIANPKPNGYRSLHLIVSVPVFFSQQKRDMKVEVQIRTIAMDYWASLEHQMKYKRELPEQEEIVKQLKECAEDIYQVDMKMMGVRRRVELAEDKLSDEDAFMAKLKKLDTPIK